MITIEQTTELYLTRDELEEFCKEQGWLDDCTKGARNRVFILCILGASAKELAQAIWVGSDIKEEIAMTYDEEMFIVEKKLIEEAKKRRGVK